MRSPCVYRTKTLAPWVALSLLGAACSKGAGQLELPSEGAQIQAFPEPTAPASEAAQAAAKPLQIVRAEPSQGEAWMGVITVVFDQPMSQASFGRPEAQGPLTISPPVEGAFSWWGTRTLVFRPSKPLAPGRRYQVSVQPSARALNGATLERPYQFEFSTPGLSAPSISASQYGALGPAATFTLGFNLPVELEQVRRHVTLLAEGQVAPVSIEPVMEGTRKEPRPSTLRFKVKPLSPLRFNSNYRVVVEGAITPQGGERPLGQRVERAFRTIGDQQVTAIRCGYQDKCSPYDSVEVVFANPIERDQIERCLTTRPKLPLDGLYVYGTRASFRLKGWDAGKSYDVTVSGDCPDVYKNKLANTLTRRITVSDHSPSLDMERRWVTLEPSSAPVFPVRTRNVERATLRMLRVTPELLAKVYTRTQGWDVRDFLSQEITPTVSRQWTPAGKKNDLQLQLVNLAEALDNRPAGVVYMDVLRDEGNAAASTTPTPQPRSVYDWALVAITDMGITAKTSASESLFWVTSLDRGSPLSQIEVTLYNKRGEVFWSGQTDAQGVARGPGVSSDDERAKNALGLVVARRGEEMALLPIGSYDHRVYSNHRDIPYAWGDLNDQLAGEVFAERGVYRPGEQVHVKGLLRMRTSKGLGPVQAKEVSISVSDPRGKVVLTRKAALTPLGGVDFKMTLDERASLGTYNVKLRPVMEGSTKAVGIAYGSFRVEAYRAPRFEVSVKPPEQTLMLGQQGALQLSGRYLFGSPMQQAAFSAYVDIEPDRFSSAQLPGFSFSPEPDDGYWWDYERRYDEHAYRAGVTSSEGKLDAKGEALIQVDLSQHLKRRGPQSLIVEASVTDVDGQVVSHSRRVPVHAADFYVGVREPGALVAAGAPFEVAMAAVDHQGALVSGKAMTLTLHRREWTSVKKRSPSGESWVSQMTLKEVGSCAKTSSAKEPVSCALSVDRGGSYTVTVQAKDAQGREVQASQYFYAWSDAQSSWWPMRDDTTIQVIPDKTSYKPGEVARLMVQSPFEQAQALITIEREGILRREVRSIQGQTPTLEIPIDASLMPNAFVSVALVRGRVKPPKADPTKPNLMRGDVGKPAFKMGYARLSIDNSAKQLQVKVEPAQPTYAPGQEAEVVVRLHDASGAPVAGEVTLMVVDEGVLSLTGYQTPEPFKRFYQERPLGVHTHEARQRLMSKLDAKGNKSAPGGDGEGEGMSFRSKFASTAAYLPTLKVDASGQAKARFTLPEQLTAYRVMAVAVAQGDRFGSGQERLTVTKPLLVRAALPRFAAAGDRFKARAVVQSVGGAGGVVQVTASAQGAVKLTGQLSQSLTLAAGQAVTVAFDAEALAPGSSTIRFAVTGEGNQMRDGVQVTLPVKHPSAQLQATMTGMLTEDSPTLWRRLSLPEGVNPEAGQLEIELSSTAYGQLLPGLEYLIDYPYGCAEQTTGRLLPLVALREVLQDYDLASLPSAQAPAFIDAGVANLLSMQTQSGGLGYWPGAYDDHPWASAYGGLALVLAQRRGHKVNKVAYERLMRYLDRLMRTKEPVRGVFASSPESARVTSTLAAYVLAEADRADAAYLELLYTKRASLPRWAKGLLALAIHRQKSGGPMTDQRQQQLQTLREEMLAGVVVQSGEASLPPEDQDETLWMLMPSATRANAIALMVLLETAPQDDLVEQLARGLLMARQRGFWESTQATSFAILALARYFETIERMTPDFEVTVGLGQEVKAVEPMRGRQLVGKRVVLPMREITKRPDQLLTLMRRGGGGPLYYTVTLRYHSDTPQTQEQDFGLTLRREYLVADAAQDTPVSEVKVGDVIKVRLTLVSPDRRRYVAVEDPLPAGLEPINTRFATTARRTAQLLQERSPDQEDDWWRYWWYEPDFNHTEQRDDRVLLFADELDASVYSHTYLVRATTPGRFAAASARAEEMYHPNVFGTSQSGSLTIR